MRRSNEFSDLNLDPIEKLALEKISTKRWRAPLVVPRELYEKPMEILVDAFLRPDSVRPKNECFFGNTDGGKTTFLKHACPAIIKIVKLAAEREKKEGATKFYGIDIEKLLTLGEYGIVTIRCHTNITLLGFERGLLEGLNWTYLKNDRIYELESMIEKAVKQQNCRVIVLDEFSQLYNIYENMNKRGSITQRQANVLQALRNIPGITKRPTVVSGTKRVLRLLDRDPETTNRYQKTEFPRFDLRNGGGLVLRKFLSTLDHHLFQTTEIKSEFANIPEILCDFYLDSKGRIGTIVKIYEKTVELALKRKLKSLSHELLGEASSKLKEQSLTKDDEAPKIVNIPLGWEEGVFTYGNQ